MNGREHVVGSQALAIETAVGETSANLRVPSSAERKAKNILVSVGAADGQVAQGMVVPSPCSPPARSPSGGKRTRAAR